MAIYKEALEENYTVVGSPAISDDYIASGLSSSNYISRPTDTTFSPGSSAWEIKAKVTTGSSLGSEEVFIDPNSDQRGLRIGFQDHSGPKWQFLVSRGSSWINVSAYYGSYTVQPNTTYWIKAGYTGSEYYLEYSTDGSEYIRDVSYSSSSTVGSYALQIRSYGSYAWRGSVDLKETSVMIGSEVWWKPVSAYLKDVSGSVEITKGYYSDGLNKIVMPASTYNIDALTANQTLGGKNKLFAYTDSTDSVGALITSTTPTGSFKITKELEQPVYLDPTKNYIAGGELIEPALSFMSGATELWERPNLTSNTSYGTVSNVYGTGDSDTFAPWKALDGDTSTWASLHTTGAGGVSWWKWELPHDIVFKNESVITFVQRNTSEGCSGWRFYADVEMTKPLGNSFSSAVSSGTSISIPCSNLSSDLRTNIIYLYNPSVSSWPGVSELQFSNVYKVGESSVSSTKALQYSEAQDTAYWIPSSETVSLDSVKALQSVGPVNDLYLTTTTGTPTASLSFSDDGEIGGVHNKLPLKQKVYLNNETDKILGVQERPDEIVITGGTTTNYTVVGSPTITDDYVASDFSSSNWIVPTINIPQPTDTDVLEIFMKVTVPTSLSSNKAFFNRSDKDRGFYVQSSSKKFGFYDGSSHLSIAATAGQTYWVGYTQDANKACKFAAMLDDGTYSSVDELPSLSDSVWGTPITWTSSEFTMVGDNVFYLGYNSTAGTYWGDGKIYLQDTVVRVVSSEGTPTTLNWTPLSVQDGITASGWSVLYSDVTDFTGNTALDYTTPVTIASSSLEIPAGYGTYTVYLYYTNGAIKYIPAGDTVLDKTVFTGYALTVSDGAIQSVNKKGELSAVFVERGYDRNTRHYLFIPAANLKEGGYFTTKAASTSVDMSSQGTLPPSEYLARMENVAYNRYDKTVYLKDINNRIKTFDYIGDMMFSFIG